MERLKDYAQRILERRPVFLDTETTGLGNIAEAVEMAIIDHDGTTLMDTLVRPVRRIPLEATQIHGITEAMVADAPTFEDLYEPIRELLETRPCVIYNKVFDIRILNQSGHARDLPPMNFLRSFCAMRLYAEWHGEIGKYGDYKWQPLTGAVERCGIDCSDLTAHRAKADRRMSEEAKIEEQMEQHRRMTEKLRTLPDKEIERLRQDCLEILNPFAQGRIRRLGREKLITHPFFVDYCIENL